MTVCFFLAAKTPGFLMTMNMVRIVTKSVILVIQTFYPPAAHSVLYNKDVYPTSFIA